MHALVEKMGFCGGHACIHVKTKFEDKEFLIDVAGFKITQTVGSLW